MNKMKKIFLFLLLAGSFRAAGQTRFFPAVKIEFEKTVYAMQLYKEVFPEWYEMVKDRIPDKVVTYHEFTGDTSRSIYKPGREVQLDPSRWYNSVADKNTIFTDFRTGRVTSQKPVYEETFLVEDSLLKIKWKLTGDTRMIAGYECRKAVGVIDDSIGIFAFYTDELLVQGGPESIRGLPGMILGLGIPRLHATWFATKVEVSGVNMNTATPPSKGKKTSRRDMVQSLEKVLKSWGESGRKMIVNFLI
jgi:GLPGLI family protein